MDPAERQALREQATQAVLKELEALEKEVAEGHGKASAGAATALRDVLKTHGRHLDPALDARVHEALTAAGELEGWQRWRADQLRQELLGKAQALLGPDKKPAMGGRKMQEALRQLREAWKQTDQGGAAQPCPVEKIRCRLHRGLQDRADLARSAQAGDRSPEIPAPATD